MSALGADDVDDLAAALLAELDRARGKREQGVVATTTDVGAGVEVGAALTHDDLAGLDDLTAEVLGDLRGPKVVIQKFKNKTGYKKRQGFRADLTRVKITGIK